MLQSLAIISDRIDELLLNYSESNRLANEFIDLRFKHYVNQIIVLFENKLLDDSLILLDYAIMELPTCVDFLHFRAICYLEKGWNDKAKSQFEEFIGVSNNVDLVNRAKNILNDLN